MDTLDKYIDKMEFFCWEGERGINQIHELCSDLGYPSQPFLHGDPLHNFLRDNPGAIETILSWIRNNMDDNWKNNLSVE